MFPNLKPLNKIQRNNSGNGYLRARDHNDLPLHKAQRTIYCGFRKVQGRSKPTLEFVKIA